MEISQLARFKWADIPAPAPVAHPIARPTALERLAAAQAGAQRCPLTVDIFDGLALLRRLRAPSPHVPSERLYRRLKYNLPPAHPFEQFKAGTGAQDSAGLLLRHADPKRHPGGQTLGLEPQLGNPRLAHPPASIFDFVQGITAPASGSSASSTIMRSRSADQSASRTARKSARSNSKRLLREGTSLIERRDAMEFFRDACAEQFKLHANRAWTPRSGSLVNRKTLTAAMVDSRDFIAARKRADQTILIPAGTGIAITGGADYQDHRRIWAALDKAQAKHPDMVLLHGGTPSGAEHIADCWARSRQVTAIVFRPDWNRHAKAAPFKRNDLLLEQLPAGVLHFPGTGISANLADKARKLGIPVWRFE